MRWRVISINAEILVWLWTQGNECHCRCVKGLPPGAKFIRIYDHYIYGLQIVVEHESFPLLKEGDLLPPVEILEMEKIYL